MFCAGVTYRGLVRPLGEHRTGAKRERLRNLAATADTAFDQHLDLSTDRIDHFRHPKAIGTSRVSRCNDLGPTQPGACLKMISTTAITTAL